MLNKYIYKKTKCLLQAEEQQLPLYKVSFLLNLFEKSKDLIIKKYVILYKYIYIYIYSIFFC